jgi:hypothetical protein
MWTPKKLIGLGIQRSKGMKCDEGETPEAPKSGVNPQC